jgi:dTDP-4-amino-4,6-dideoxygalactose transaminase
VEGLAERGIGSLLYYPVPIHRQAYLQLILPGAADLPLPVTDRLSEEIVSIPVRPSLTDDELAAVVAAVREVATPAAEPGRTETVAS